MATALALCAASERRTLMPETCTVMQLVLSLCPGGTERLVVELVKRLPSSFRSVVCCLDEPGAWGERLKDRGTTVISLGRRPGFRPSLGRRIADIAAAHDVQVIHAHHYSPYVYAQLAALRSPATRIVFTEHGRLSDGKPSLKRRLANGLLARLPASVHTVSTDLKQHLAAEGFPAHRIGVISNGIDAGSPAAPCTRAAARKALDVRPDAFVVGTIARLDPIKDLPTLLEGFARFSVSVPSAMLVVIGDGVERARLTRLAAALGVGETVRFLGHREDARALLAGFDVYVSTSIFEGVSLTLLEAMAAALPVVATAVGGTPEVVIDGETGRLIPPRDPQMLSGILQVLYDVPHRATEWGGEGRRRVLRHFTIDTMIEKYARIYRGQAD